MKEAQPAGGATEIATERDLWDLLRLDPQETPAPELPLPLWMRRLAIEHPHLLALALTGTVTWCLLALTGI